MRQSKEEEALLASFASSALQGWFARFSPEDTLARVNYEVVATGCYRMAMAMLRKHKQVVKSGNNKPDDKES